MLTKPAKMLHPLDARRLEYENICDEDTYRIPFVEELLDVLHDNIHVEGFSYEELNSILHYLCTSQMKLPNKIMYVNCLHASLTNKSNNNNNTTPVVKDQTVPTVQY